MRARILLLASVLAVVPCAAMADTGMPLLLPTSPQLWIATVVLGVLEGAILARMFKLKLRRCVGFMIPANILTSWLGLELFGTFHGAVFSADSLPALLVIVVTMFVLTLVLEWPFVAFCVRGLPNWFKRSVQGSLAAQGASYGVLIVLGIGSAAIFPRPENDFAALASMKSDLRNLVTAEESYFADHVTYTGNLAHLQYQLSYDVVISIAAASSTGWSATARVPVGASTPPGFGSRKTCAIFVGNAAPPLPGLKEGEPGCR